MPTTRADSKTFCVAGITPYFLERGALWFAEHAADIRRKAHRDDWWRRHTLFLEEDAVLPFSPMLRKLADMGYAKVSQVAARGEFAVRGGILDVFPINREQALRIEFDGNAVSRVIELPVLRAEPLSVLRPKDPTTYETLWLSNLKPGVFVVHADHGIGVFRGFEKDRGTEFYSIEYAPPRRGGMPDRLLVPRRQSPKLSRYVGFETPTVHRLGGMAWETTKRKVREDAQHFAEELVGIFRKRIAASRPPYPRHAEVGRELDHSFAYAMTGGQRRALAAIESDLSQAKPMDRLLVGDVGFGKTEVAIRVAARAAYSGRQVAVLAPTTVLADQHGETFRQRLGALPINVALLSRLASRREARRIIREIRNGAVDIAVGTHRLLSADIAWRDLGLVIIDEEQRFGVHQKETFKKFRAAIDMLSLSATPIPRTLSLALAKLRDVSLIEEPPAGRFPTKTFVLPYAAAAAREAIQAELARGGQVFYLWNRIETLDTVRRDVAAMAARARIAVLHGRMREQELIRTMHGFREGTVDVLVATTIIENGLDLPNVNTLVVANASRLGLAQAHQLRGRIGRGDRPSYAYFFFPPRSLTDEARLRLDALREAEGPGAGMQLALRDLEIRGAGNVLGRQQSGAVNRVGLNLYAHLLGEALEELSST